MLAAQCHLESSRLLIARRLRGNTISCQKFLSQTTNGWGFLSLFRCDAKLAVTTLPSIEVELRLRPSLSLTLSSLRLRCGSPSKLKSRFCRSSRGKTFPRPLLFPCEALPTQTKQHDREGRRASWRRRNRCVPIWRFS